MNRLLRFGVRYCALFLLVAFALPALGHAQGITYKGAGPRIGISSDPDQVFIGGQFDLGEFTKNLRFQPTVELGFGDDVTLFAANAGALYFFPVKGEWKPYVGGEVGFVYQNFDKKNKANDTDIALNAVGGMEKGLKSGSRFLAELKVGLVADPKIQLLAGWTF